MPCRCGLLIPTLQLPEDVCVILESAKYVRYAVSEEPYEKQSCGPLLHRDDQKGRGGSHRSPPRKQL